METNVTARPEGAASSPAEVLDASAIRSKLHRVAHSPQFSRSPRMRDFIQFLVEEHLAGRAAQLKEYTIAISVFQKPQDFDPSTNATVRVEAGRLRRLLEQYEAEWGADDDLILSVPKGSYVPVFAPRSTACGSVGMQMDATVAPVQRLALAPWAQEQRRLVTVISCALTERDHTQTDEEEFPTGFGELHACCTRIGTAYGGHVDAGAGDRLICYFGWPDSLEDGSGRALTAALEMIAAVQANPAGARFGIQIGAATGDVVVRDVDYCDDSTQPPVIGLAPQIATKLMLRAPIDSVIVADATRRLAREVFKFMPAGSIGEGPRGQELLWRALKASGRLTRFCASHSNQSGTIVGRAEEVALLLSRWRLSLEGEGLAVLVLGDAGIGKSKLVETVLDSIPAPNLRLRLQCSSHHANSALYPFIELLKGKLGQKLDSPIDVRPLTDFLNASGLGREADKSIIAELLNLTDSKPLDRASASQRKAFALDMLRRLVLAHAEQQATVLLVEDVHWADPTSLEVINELVAAAAGRPLLLLITSRPELSAHFTKHNHLVALRLSRLPKADCNELIDRVASSASISPATRTAILDRSGGIPLFLEELTKLVLTKEIKDFRAPLLPKSLSELLASQLGRLGNTRGVAQAAAVIGSSFSREMLVAVWGHSGDEINRALDHLLAAGVFVEHCSEAGNGFSFRHALLRDAAYGTLLEGARQSLHGRVSAVLLEKFPNIASEHPDLVARHLMEAGRRSESISFWVDAGRKAAARYALAEAMANFSMALEALGELTDSRELRETELEVLIDLGLVTRSARGYFDETLFPIFDRASKLAFGLGKKELHLNALYGLWTHTAGNGQWPSARAMAMQFSELAHDNSSSEQSRIEALRLVAASAAFSGDLVGAREGFERLLVVYDPRKHGPGFGVDPGAVSAAYLAWIKHLMGDSQQAAECAALALRVAGQKDHPPTTAMVLFFLIFYAVCAEDSTAVLTYNDRLQTVCGEHDCQYWRPFGAACAEWAAFQSDPDSRRLDRFLAFSANFRERYMNSCLLVLAAGMCLALKRYDQGMTLIERALIFMNQHDERVWEAEVSRLRGALLIRSQPAAIDRAGHYFETALEAARRQSAVVFAQRATRLLRESSPLSAST